MSGGRMASRRDAEDAGGLPARVLQAMELASEALEEITVLTGIEAGDKARRLARVALKPIQDVLADMG